MKRREKINYDDFTYLGIELELEEVKAERDLLIKLLEEKHIPVPEKIRRRREEKEKLPFD